MCNIVEGITFLTGISNHNLNNSLIWFNLLTIHPLLCTIFCSFSITLFKFCSFDLSSSRFTKKKGSNCLQLYQLSKESDSCQKKNWQVSKIRNDSCPKNKNDCCKKFNSQLSKTEINSCMEKFDSCQNNDVYLTDVSYN